MNLLCMALVCLSESVCVNIEDAEKKGMISILYRLLTAAVQRQLGRTHKVCILPSIIIIDFIIFVFQVWQVAAQHCCMML